MSLNFQKNVPLAPLTTLQIGGDARLFLRAEKEDEVAGAVTFAREEGLPVFILGGGSNILVSDAGFDGLVLQIALKGVSIDDEAVTAAAGEDWDRLVERCLREGLAGVECMSGIPGFVGGTPVQNVGAYGQEVADTIASVRCFDREGGNIVTLNTAACGFTYRTSIFNSTHRERFVVLSVEYHLTRGGIAQISYRDLERMFVGRTPSLGEVRDAVIRIRREKSMVIDPADPNCRSAGSFFKNPIVGRGKVAELEAAEGKVPYFEFGADAKIPAAWLIERAGFPKGFTHGSVGISTNHTLAIINRGNAKAVDIISLNNLIQSAVRDKFGIDLQPEPVFIGFD